ncbi:MAG: GTP-binding protein, partial [Planctomycetia bacterium]|nr:GTP-binding protein [Planctomycetia bacterium]
MNQGETIVAVASPLGAAARAILRLSGTDALAVADRVFEPDCEPRLRDRVTFSACTGRLRLDAGLEVPAEVYIMRSPRSYTREDVVEFHVGSWPALLPSLLEGFTRAGARLAEPREFTARAFLSGRLDLAQAEAVMAVVNASTGRALKAAAETLQGRLSERLASLADEIRNLLALVEAGIDFSTEDIEIIAPSALQGRLLELRRRLVELGRQGRSLRTYDGSVRLVIAGRPNAGKSSLFNALLGRRRTIVAEAPGTTRDRVSDQLVIGDLAFELSDTAGLATPGDEIEAAAHKKALEALDVADLALVAFEADKGEPAAALEILRSVASPVVIVITKCDLAPAGPVRRWLTEAAPGLPVVDTSAETGQGIAELKDLLAEVVEGGGAEREAVHPIITARHKLALSTAAEATAAAHHLAGAE